MKIKWNIVHEADDDNGNPTIWATSFNGKLWWICLNSEDKYDCEVKQYEEIRKVMTCKSLTSAKRWISINYWKYT